jgi:hypothetical protein
MLSKDCGNLSCAASYFYRIYDDFILAFPDQDVMAAEENPLRKY